MAAARRTLSRRPVRVAARLALILLLAAGLAALTVIAAPAHAGDEGGPVTAFVGADPAPATTFGPDLVAPVGEETRGDDYGKDWQHCVQVVANLRAEHPKVPLVVLLGGSAARECTVLDDDWERQIERRGGYVVDAYNLGSKHRTYAEDLAFVKLLPANVPTIVYIGVNLGRFCPPAGSASITLPRPRPLPVLRAARLLEQAHPELLHQALLRLVLADGPLPRVPRPLHRGARHAAEDHPGLQAPAPCASRWSTCPGTCRSSAPRSTDRSRATTPAARASPGPGTSRGCTSTARRSSATATSSTSSTSSSRAAPSTSASSRTRRSGS